MESLRFSSDNLFLSEKTSFSSIVRAEAEEVRDRLKELRSHELDRAIVKLSFLWHRDMADMFSHVASDALSRVGVLAPALISDMARRAETIAQALETPCVSVDLLCSRFAPGKSPVHVDYGEFLHQDGLSLDVSDRRALSFVMPYVGEGTQYLRHTRDLVERELRDGVKQRNNTIDGLGEDLRALPGAERLEWVQTANGSFTMHRNGLSLHRSPSSDEFRLLLAIDGCVPEERMAQPMLGIREKILRNARVLRG